jgi:hypothetical protein
MLHALNNGLAEIFSIVNLITGNSNEPYTLEQLRAGFYTGVWYLLFSAPILFYFIFKNRIAADSMPPYYERVDLQLQNDSQGIL